MSERSRTAQAFVFKNRGALLGVPALILAVFGKPALASIIVGVPIALLGELVRCWAVGYSGVTTRGDTVEAPELVTAGPYAYARNPLYVGNFITAVGFALAFTGGNSVGVKSALIVAVLAFVGCVYAVIVPYEEQFLAREFGEAFDRYRSHVPAYVPRSHASDGNGTWKPEVIAKAETRTFVTFGIMLAILLVKWLFWPSR